MQNPIPMMQTLKTKQPALLFVLLSTLLLISCGGQNKNKNTISENAKDTESEQSVDYLKETIQVNNNLGQDQSGNAIIESDVKYNNNNGIDADTFEFNDLKKIVAAQETKIIFPNGKTLSDIKDAAIMKDVPKEALVYYQSSEEELFIKEVDLKKVSKAQKAKWFSQMKLHSNVKLSDLDYMKVHSHLLGLDETPGRVCLAAYGEIWSKMGELVGRIAHLDIYDYDGKLTLQIPMYEYGGELFTVTKDQKYLLANVNGSRFGDSDFGCGYISPKLNIYSIEDGKLDKQLNMPCWEDSFYNPIENFISFGSQDFKGRIHFDNKLIKIIRFTDEIRFQFKTFTTDGVITNDGKLWKFEKYSFDEWNSMDLSIFEENRQ